MPTQLTKKQKLCRDCHQPMEAWEHPAAKTCLKCRDPKAYAVKMAEVKPIAPVPALGEILKPAVVMNVSEQLDPLLPMNHIAPTPAPRARSAATPFFLKSGDEVSINLKQRKFLILPKSKWELNTRRWTAVIPDNIDPVELRMLRTCLENGDIVKGNVYTGIERKPGTLSKAVKILKRPEAEMRKKLGLIVQQRGLVDGYMPYEIFRHLIRYEDDNEHRKKVLDFLQSALDTIGSGPIKNTPVINKTIEQVTGMKF